MCFSRRIGKRREIYEIIPVLWITNAETKHMNIKEQGENKKRDYTNVRLFQYYICVTKCIEFFMAYWFLTLWDSYQIYTFNLFYAML